MPLNSHPPLRLHIYNVGQGSCMLIEIPGKIPCFGIVDCHDPTGLVGETILDRIGNFPDARLDFVIVTHPEMDHVLGLSALISKARNRFRKGASDPYSGFTRFYEGAAPVVFCELSRNLRRWMSQHAHGANSPLLLELSRLGDLHDTAPQDSLYPLTSCCRRFEIAPGLHCEVLAPLPRDGQRIAIALRRYWKRLDRYCARVNLGLESLPPMFPSLNGGSLALLLTYAPSLGMRDLDPGPSARLLVCGDVTRGTWRALREQQLLRPVHFATVPHHGGKGNPRYLWEALALHEPQSTKAIISCGSFEDGRTRAYDHPARDTLRALRDHGISMHCTNLGNRCRSDRVKQEIQEQRRQIQESVRLDPSLVRFREEDVRERYADDLECSGSSDIELYEDGRIDWKDEIKCAWRASM